LQVDIACRRGPSLEKRARRVKPGAWTCCRASRPLCRNGKRAPSARGHQRPRRGSATHLEHPLKSEADRVPKDVKSRAPAEQPGRQVTQNMNVVLRSEKISGDDIDVRLVHTLAEKDIKYSARSCMHRSATAADAGQALRARRRNSEATEPGCNAHRGGSAGPPETHDAGV